MTRGDAGDFIDPAYDEAIRLCEQMLERDRPVIVAAIKGVITGDVYRGSDGAWRSKGQGPDRQELSRLLNHLEPVLDELAAWQEERVTRD